MGWQEKKFETVPEHDMARFLKSVLHRGQGSKADGGLASKMPHRIGFYLQILSIEFALNHHYLSLSDWRPSLGDLEPTRHHRLEHTQRIIFLSHSLNVIIVCLPVARQRILRLVCIVKVDVRVVSTDANGIVIQLLDV